MINVSSFELLKWVAPLCQPLTCSCLKFLKMSKAISHWEDNSIPKCSLCIQNTPCSGPRLHPCHTVVPLLLFGLQKQEQSNQQRLYFQVGNKGCQEPLQLYHDVIFWYNDCSSDLLLYQVHFKLLLKNKTINIPCEKRFLAQLLWTHTCLKKLIHQLARLCEKEDHHPSIRWFEGEDPYWWAFSAANSSFPAFLK